MPNYLKFIIAVVATQAAGLIGAFFTAPAIPTWYENLSKPDLNPPSAVFGPVWTTLYLLMAIAAFIIWKSKDDTSPSAADPRKRAGMQAKSAREANLALGVFIGQLVLNTFWSIIFFGMKSLGGALIEISVLWLAIIATIILFWRISKTAGWLLAPYILWVTFAGYLNYMIWAMN